MEKCKIKFPHPTKLNNAIEVHLHQTTWQHTSCEVPSFIARVELRTGQYCSCSIFSLSVKRAQELTSLPHPKLITHQPTYLPTHLPKPLPTHLPTHLPTYQSLYQPTCLPTHLLTHPPKPVGARKLMQYWTNPHYLSHNSCLLPFSLA